MPNRTNLTWFRYLPVWIILCFGVTMSLVAFIVVWNWENRRRNYEFSRRTELIANTLQQNLDSDLEAIRTIGDFFTASKDIDRIAFERLVQRPLSQHLSIEAAIWVTRVTDEQRYEYEENLRQQHNPTFVIQEENSPGQLVYASSQPEYLPISYIQPNEGDRAILGFNLASDPLYRQILADANRQQQLIVTRLISWPPHLPTESLKLLAVQPIYDPVPPLSSGVRGDRDRDNLTNGATPELQGYVLAVLRIQNLFDDKFRGSVVKNLNLYLCDTAADSYSSDDGKSPSFLLAFSEFSLDIGQTLEPGVRCPFSGQKDQKYELLETDDEKGIKHQINIADDQWNLFLMLTPEYRQIQTKHWRSWATLIIGMLWTLIPVTYMVTSMSRTAQIERLAQERTKQAEQLQQAFQQLETEQRKSEQLLLNVLPKPIADRLKQNTEVIADSFSQVTILFADIVGFTKMSTRIPPRKLVELLNEIFSAFDELAVNHGLEKIKTIGDAYMVVGGLPVERPDHAEAIAEMALDMQEAIARIDIKHREAFCMRIGIHTGPVVAGVIGTHKFIYDLWGDSVNIASRMESHGIPGCIQVSQATYEILQDKYIFEKRGTIPVKGRGDMTTYFLLTNKRIMPVPPQR